MSGETQNHPITSATGARAPDDHAYLKVLLQIIEVQTDAGCNLLSSAEDEAYILAEVIAGVEGLPPDLREVLKAKAAELVDWFRHRHLGPDDQRKPVIACYQMAVLIRNRAFGGKRP